MDALRFADRRVGALSGGEQQRVLLATALIGRPRGCCCSTSRWRTSTCAVNGSGGGAAKASPRRQEISVLLSAHDMNPLLPMRWIGSSTWPRAGQRRNRRGGGAPDVLSELYRQRVDVLRAGGRYVVLAGSGGRLEGGHCDPKLDQASPG